MQTRTTRTFCHNRTVKVGVISKLAQQKIAANDWRQQDIQTRMKMMADSLKGPTVVHDKGWMLRNISEENIEVTSLESAKARIVQCAEIISNRYGSLIEFKPDEASELCGLCGLRITEITL